ncbi:methyltransferase family protein [Luteimonas aquatica]|uniref:methyltransferase family protein n=1 Tax=Luteimonas aquatica TaxID=450364 RepID=UPI001F5879C6|nr:isoprenylcysteine carboxylmethyltransferase family protein [Luteimonas aquatica]
MMSSPLLALCLLWLASEWWIGRKRAADRSRDAGTLRLLWIVFSCALIAGVWLALLPAGRFPPSLHAPLFWAGCALMLAGIALRWWAVQTLAEFFTVDVAIRPGQTLVREGPYRWLRHPSYTGVLLTFLGFSLSLGSWLSVLAVCIPMIAALVMRIRVEESVLADAFPQAYPEYARTTKRLIPFLW